MNNVIGERIAKLRKSSGEKQEDLAEVLGCNRGSLANYETGKRTPDIDTIIKIAQHYKTTTDYILGVTDNKQQIPLSKQYATIQDCQKTV